MTGPRFVRRLAVTLAVAVGASLAPGLPAGAAPPDEERWRLTRERSTPGRNAVAQPSTPDAAARAALSGTRPVTWPRAGSAVVALGAAGAARAGDLPVSVGAVPAATPGASASAPSAVRVEVLDRATTARARREGVLLRVGRADRAADAGRVRLEVDYSGFRHAGGGDWGGRLRLLALPECALSTPELAGCGGTPLPTHNDVTSGRLASDLTADAGTGGLFAVTAGEQSSSGTFVATPLAASAGRRPTATRGRSTRRATG